MVAVELDGVGKTYGDEVAVEGLDLTVADGEILGVVGPSGCGKTTTLRTIAGFETPTAGRVRFADEDVTHVPPERRNVGLVFQSYALFDNMSVLANVAFGPKMQGVEKTERRDRAMELLELLDIAELADRAPETLSGGQQQRVGLARALAIEPNILLLDEPMTGLDAKLKDRLRREIGSLLDELGVTALYVTHDQEEAMAMCDRIAVLNDGRLEQVGTPREIYESPANEFVAGFVGSANLLDAQLDDGTVDLGFTRLHAVTDDTSGNATVVVRPDDIAVGSGSIPVTIREYQYLGETTSAVGELPDGQQLRLRLNGTAEETTVGTTVSVAIDPDGVAVVDTA
ncbi:ABC transporter ATP-binding protein [Halomicrobium mukohataei]|uniref:Molybdate/tungstate import ATP-binding protein WtpC n=2 Tax=Halomicrobium mukohataei TaxID=57705 RepID=C7P4R2_HALMD|nr:ABC transporter ATP-binding protein [Halomicrobium mukohataei]ACV49483.1 ABC transporter related [Halomicrobium mukohataei DSM 12286]QCD67146.1 ABC transporter ATP-binding protein [Halomicrobium mukohataei]